MSGLNRAQGIKSSLYEVTPLISAAMIMMSSGSVNLVSAFTSKLETLLGMSTSEINLFMTLVGLGSFFAVIPMALVDAYGPKRIVLIGMVMILVGYVLVGLAAQGLIDISIGSVLVLGFVIGHGSVWTSASAIVPNTKNSKRKDRGASTGILMGYFALSAGLYVQISEIFSTNTPDFLYIVGSLMSFLLIVAWPSQHLMQEGCSVNSAIILPMGISIVVFAVLVAIASISNNAVMHIIGFICFLITGSVVSVCSAALFHVYGFQVFSTTPFKKKEGDSIQLKFCGYELSQQHEQTEDRSGGEVSPLLTNNESQTQSNFDGISSRSKPSENIDSLTVMEALQTPHLWLLVFGLGVGCGGGITFLYNVSPIVDALSAKDSDDDVHDALKTNSVALFAAFNTITRVMFGFLSDWLGSRWGISRAWMLFVNSLLMAVASLSMAYTSLSTFSFLIVLSGIGFGGYWSLVPSLVADLFGPVSFGALFGFVQLGAMVGTLLIYDVMSTAVYDENRDGGSDTCYDNRACFKLTFIILSGLLFLNALAFFIIAKTPSPLAR